MRESWESMLRGAEESVEPREEFVEGLAAELGSVVENTRASKRRSPLGVGAAAVVVLVLAVGGIVFSLNGPTLESDLPATSEVDPGLPIASAETDMPLSMSQACDSFLVAVSSFLRPGIGQQIATSDSIAGLPETSASLLYGLRDQLKQISELHELHGDGGLLTGYGFNEAMSELSQAALFVQLGEFGQAEESLVTTRSLIRDLADEPGLVGCLEL